MHKLKWFLNAIFSHNSIAAAAVWVCERLLHLHLCGRCSVGCVEEFQE